MTSDAPKELIERGVFAAERHRPRGTARPQRVHVDDVNTFAEPRRATDARRDPRPRHSRRPRAQRALPRPARAGRHPPRTARRVRHPWTRVGGRPHRRGASSGAFQQRDADALAPSRARSPAASARRCASMRRDASPASSRRGWSCSAPHDEVELITPPARELLGVHPGESGYTDETIAATGARARVVHPRGASTAVRAPATSSPCRQRRMGDAARLAARTSGPRPGRGRPRAATGARSATVRLEAFGATAREREVATLLARGLSRAEMAETLVISPHTVEDHVKSLYEKLGVASRQELVARVFLDEYLPEVVRQTPLTSRGRFDIK